MISHTGAVLTSATAHKDNTVLLHIMTYILKRRKIVSALEFTFLSHTSYPHPPPLPCQPLPPPSPRLPHPISSPLPLQSEKFTYAPIPGIYAVTDLPLLNLTLATFRSAEFGFLGFITLTFRQTAFICGRLTNAGDVAWRARRGVRGLRRICISVAEMGWVVENGLLLRWGRWRGGVMIWWERKRRERTGERIDVGIVEELERRSLGGACFVGLEISYVNLIDMELTNLAVNYLL